jgi:hypothetical protein
MTENRFHGQYKNIGNSTITNQDKQLLHESNREIKVYLSAGQIAPEGRETREGSGGGRYYITQKHTPKSPSIEGAQRAVRVSGDGVGIIAGTVDGKLSVKSLKNKETAGFIRKVVACAGTDNPGKFLTCMKKVAESQDLEVSG